MCVKLVLIWLCILFSDLKLGLPKTSREAFKLLEENDIIDHALTKTLMNIVGFRNIAVHDYQAIDLNILQAIIENHLTDFKTYSEAILLK